MRCLILCRFLQLLWRIDQGEAVQITGIPDLWLRDALQGLFKNLGLANSSKVEHPKQLKSLVDLCCLGAILVHVCSKLGCLQKQCHKATQGSRLGQSAFGGRVSL